MLWTMWSYLQESDKVCFFVSWSLNQTVNGIWSESVSEWWTGRATVSDQLQNCTSWFVLDDHLRSSVCAGSTWPLCQNAKRKRHFTEQRSVVTFSTQKMAKNKIQINKKLYLNSIIYLWILIFCKEGGQEEKLNVEKLRIGRMSVEEVCWRKQRRLPNEDFLKTVLCLLNKYVNESLCLCLYVSVRTSWTTWTLVIWMMMISCWMQTSQKMPRCTAVCLASTSWSELQILPG